MICTSDLTPKFLSAMQKCPSLTHIVEMHTPSSVDHANQVTVFSIEEVEHCGFEHRCDNEPAGADDIVTLVYHSEVYALFTWYATPVDPLEQVKVQCSRMNCGDTESHSVSLHTFPNEKMIPM